MASCRRPGSGTMLPHSTHRTLPALCSSSVTQSEMRRLCLQAQRGLSGMDCGAGLDPSRFTVYLWDGKQELRADWRYPNSLVYAMQDTKYGNVVGSSADTWCQAWPALFMNISAAISAATADSPLRQAWTWSALRPGRRGLSLALREEGL